MSKQTKTFAVVSMVLLLSMMALSVLNLSIVNAQGQATVNILDSIGGTPDPAAGPHTYDAGTDVQLTANPDNGFVFLYWIISTEAGSNLDVDNPTTLTVSADTVYSVQAVFQPISIPTQPYIPPVNTTANAVVVVLPASGGTTNPPPGTYALASASQLTLTAVPDSGWEFSHWVISGGPMTGHGGYPFTATPADNPYTVGHGEGYTYDYQPVFFPTGTTEPSNSSPTGLSTEAIAIIVGLVVVLAVVLIAFGVLYSRRSKK